MRGLILASLFAASTAFADPTGGVDVTLLRPAYDTGGVFSLEGARLMPKRDLSFKLQTSYARSPLDVRMPGIGGTGDDSVLDYVVTVDMTFGMSLTDRFAIGFDAGGYRTATGAGYGVRGRYRSGMLERPSTGLISLRPLTNIDPSATGDNAYLGDELAGPLDVRVGAKYALYAAPQLAVAVIGTVVLPFGDDEMLLGDKNLVYEPALALEWRRDHMRLLANVGARIRSRTVLEAYDTMTETSADAHVVLDVGSELSAGAGGTYEITPRVLAAVEASLLAPLPSRIGYGHCRRYNGGPCGSGGDTTLLATVGALIRVSADVTAAVTIGTGQLGARGDDIRVTTGLVWSPQPEGAAAPGRHDRDGDGVADSLDGCPDDAEDKDGYQDEDGCADPDNDGDGIADADDACLNDAEDKDAFEDSDGCPEPDNDKDGVLDATDRCPAEAEDTDGWQDDDGCLDPDNDGDGVEDGNDTCPNDAETINGVDDEDGCPDVRATNGPEERAGRIDFKGQVIGFDRANKPAPQARTLLVQAAAIIKARKLVIRVEVHARTAKVATARARAIVDVLAAQGVGGAQAAGLAGDDRVELIEVQP